MRTYPTRINKAITSWPTQLIMLKWPFIYCLTIIPCKPLSPGEKCLRPARTWQTKCLRRQIEGLSSNWCGERKADPRSPPTCEAIVTFGDCVWHWYRFPVSQCFHSSESMAWISTSFFGSPYIVHLTMRGSYIPQEKLLLIKSVGISSLIDLD